MEVNSSGIEYINKPKGKNKSNNEPEYPDYEFKDLNLSPQEEARSNSPQAWLITFTDIMALMLTFFVLLFSMSVPDEGLFDQSLSKTLDANKFLGHRNFAGDQDSQSISTSKVAAGLDLGYLSSLIQQAGADNPSMQKVNIIRNANNLVLVLPEDVAFESGRAELSVEANDVLRDIAGVLANVDNQITVVGHADPEGGNVAENYWINWSISLQRAQAVGAALASYGINQKLIVRGLSQARFVELPDSIGEEQRNALSRRVDLVISPYTAK